MSVPVQDPRPLVAHVLYRFDTGGLENGVVNLINRLPQGSYRHAVIALTTITDFRQRIKRDDVEYIALDKRSGHGAVLYPQVARLFAAMRPAIVHTRNLAALEMAVPAWVAGVPVRIHGEHGRDIGDLDGSRRRYQWVRRAYRPFVDHYVALSNDLFRYLVERVGVPRNRVDEICNGVDTERFRPAPARAPIDGCPFLDAGHWLVGTVGRMQPVKDQVNLVRAFVLAVEQEPALRARLRLVLIGDGPLLADARTLLEAAGMLALAWLPGERPDIPAILRGLDCFVLPSLAEGISNTILEAMASGLPVVATAVGGNPELVEAGVTGELVAPADHEALAQRLIAYAQQPDTARAAGRNGRQRVEERYALTGMVARYDALYARLLATNAPAARAGARAA
jgi:sugar transferase (PEP-CTERM/EpsH1 system associated)